jgi:hypothetical protein
MKPIRFIQDFLCLSSNNKEAQVQVLYLTSHIYSANERPMRIQYKCLVPIYVFPEMKLLFTTQNYNVLYPSSYTHLSVRDLNISRIGLPILLQGNMWADPWNI